MPNDFDKIVEKEKQKTLAKQDADVARFSKKVADEVAGKIGDLELKESVAFLATTIAEAVVLSNETFDANLKDNFSLLLAAVQENKPDGTQQELSEKIGRALARLEKTLGGLQLSPEINLTALSQEELRTELNVLLEKLPSGSSNEVVIAYENAAADQYINVRLTDGFKFYTAGGGAVIMGGSGGSSNGLTDEQLRASPVPVLVDGLEIDFPPGGATEAKQDAGNALLTTIDTHVDGLEAKADTTNTKLDTLHSDMDGVEGLLTTIDGHVDGLETKADATNTKLDSVIGYVDGLETTTAAILAKQRTEYGLNDKENTGTYLYYGMESAAGTWKIIRKTIATNVFRYAAGASNYTTAWAGRAGQTYDTFGNTF